MHAEAREFVAQFAGPFESVVEIGSRNVNGGVRDLFPTDDYTGIDVEPGDGVDVVASGATYSHPSQVSLVVCCEVLEHTPDAELIVKNAAHMLAPGGLLLLTCATDPRVPHSAIDGGPLRLGEFYRNVPAEDVADWLQGFEGEIETHEDRGDLYAYARR